MVQKYIIDKTDLPKLIRGEELALARDSKYRAFCIEINEKLTNGDVIKVLFPNGSQVKGAGIYIMDDNKSNVFYDFEWWNTPYKAGDTDGNS